MTLEAHPVFEHGLLTDLAPDIANRASDLIEDFMIAANGVVARYLRGQGFAVAAARAADTRALGPDRSARCGHGRPPARQARRCRLERIPDSVSRSGPGAIWDVSLSVIKLLGRGEYIVQRPGDSVDGHFGLAVRDYAHSTAPNRRFPDLLTQRLLKAALSGQSAPYSDAELNALAAHCTQQEGEARKVERQVGKSAAALLLSNRIGQRFDALVTGASPTATWVRIREPTVEGLLVRGSSGLDVGDHVRVELIHTDVARGFIDFARAG